MDELPLVESMVRHLATNLSVPITVKIRKFPEVRARRRLVGGLPRALLGRLTDRRPPPPLPPPSLQLERTIEYAKMLERAGAYLIAIHGRTREQKQASAIRADWDAIRAVRQALRVPVLGNGNIQTLEDCGRLMEYTGGGRGLYCTVLHHASWCRRTCLPHSECTC